MPASDLMTGRITPVNGAPVVTDPHGNPHPEYSYSGGAWYDKPILQGLFNYFGFGKNNPISGTGNAGSHLTIPGTGTIDLDDPVMNSDLYVEPGSGINNANGDNGKTSAKDEDDQDFSSILGSSAIASSEGLSMLKKLYELTGDKAYLELIATSVLNRENTISAREWEKMMSDTSFSRMVDDIKRKGYNPWLALQGGSLGQAGAYNTSAAQVGSAGVSNSARSEENNIRTTSSANMRQFLTLALVIMMGFLKLAA